MTFPKPVLNPKSIETMPRYSNFSGASRAKSQFSKKFKKCKKNKILIIFHHNNYEKTKIYQNLIFLDFLKFFEISDLARLAPEKFEYLGIVSMDFGLSTGFGTAIRFYSDLTNIFGLRKDQYTSH